MSDFWSGFFYGVAFTLAVAGMGCWIVWAGLELKDWLIEKLKRKPS
jgi:hypothetical protein